MSLLYVFLFLKSLSFSQNVNIEDYRKMIEEALSRQQGDRGGRTTEFRIERVGGSVEILSMGEERAHLSNNYQYPLEVGDIIRVGYDGEANIYINNIGVIKVLRNTEFEISETQGEDILSLNYGSIVSRIERFKNSYTFKVKTPSAICNIKGTQFAVEHNKLSRESIFGVIDEGEIEVYAGENESENNVYKVSKNQEIVINPLSKRFRVSNLSRLSIYKGKISAIKKALIEHKKKWRYFSQAERIKYRQRLFNKNYNQKSMKKSLKSKTRVSR